MSESKMREALERLVAVVVKRNCDGMEWGDNFGELMTALGVSHAALAQQPAAVVELTDAEIDGFFEDHGWCPDEMYYTVVRDIIAAHEAKKNGGGL